MPGPSLNLPDLPDNFVEDLIFNKGFFYPGMVRRGQPADGSCYFHAIADAFFAPYHAKSHRQEEIVLRMRKELAHRLPEAYHKLSRGGLESFGKALPEYSLRGMQKILLAGVAVDYVYQEFISDCIDKDIYIIDSTIQDVVVMSIQDDDILYKNRESIVLLFLPGHYELVGCRRVADREYVQTLFLPDDPFILAIRARQRYLRQKRIKTGLETPL